MLCAALRCATRCKPLKRPNASKTLQLALTEALHKHLLPAMERELRVRLLAEAREAVLRDMGDSLWRFCTQVGCCSPRVVVGEIFFGGGGRDVQTG